MNILYIATSFPEPDKGATIYTDLAEGLHEAGHNITVVVSEQKRNKKFTEIKSERGFEVLRVVTGNYYDVGLLKKGLTTLKIPILMRLSMKKYLINRKYDFILFESPPVTNERLVRWAKRKYNCRAYLMLKDIFPQNAIDLEMIRPNGLLHRYFRKKEKKLYMTADIIGCMSKANNDYIISHNLGVNEGKLEIFPNTKKIKVSDYNNEGIFRKKYGIPMDAKVFLYGGNMGKPQYIELLSDIIIAFKEEKDVYFLFIGRGTDKYKIENSIAKHEIKNAIIIDNLHRNEYEEIVKEIDIGLILLDPRFTIPNYPSRILSYMEYSKPVLALTDKVTDIRTLVEEVKCGFWIWSGDTEGAINKIREISKFNGLSLMGQNGRKYMETHFDVKQSIRILEKHFER